MEQFWTIFWSVIGVITMGLATWITTYITSLLSSKIKDKDLRRFALALNDIVTRAVITVNQTYVDVMKGKNAFDKDAQAEAFKQCKAIVDSQLTKELKTYIEDNFGDITTYITSLIESTIVGLKK